MPSLNPLQFGRKKSSTNWGDPETQKLMDAYDKRKKDASNDKHLHYHTEYLDPEHGYPLNEHGDWAMDHKMNITDDSMSEVHSGKKDCEGTSCKFYQMSKEERQPFHDWAVDHA